MSPTTTAAAAAAEEQEDGTAVQVHRCDWNTLKFWALTGEKEMNTPLKDSALVCRQVFACWTKLAIVSSVMGFLQERPAASR